MLKKRKKSITGGQRKTWGEAQKPRPVPREHTVGVEELNRGQKKRREGGIVTARRRKGKKKASTDPGLHRGVLTVHPERGILRLSHPKQQRWGETL